MNKPKHKFNFVKKIFNWPAFPAMALFLLFLTLNQILSPGYLGKSFITSFLSANTPLIVVSLGVSLVLLSGGMDISMGGLLCLINVVYVTLAMKGYEIVPTVLITLCVGIAAGLLNGISIAIFRVTPLLTTFATSSIFSGIALWIMPQPTGRVQKEIVVWSFRFLNGFGAPLLFIFIELVLTLYLKNSKFGMWIYAIGQNEMNAYASGIPVRQVKLIVYAFSGFITAVGGIAQTAYIGAGDPLIAISMTMSVIAACVIGGILLTGGIGDPVGALFGAMFLGLVITTVLSSVKNSFYHNFVQGLILLFGVIGSILLAGYIKKLRNQREKSKS